MAAAVATVLLRRRGAEERGGGGGLSIMDAARMRGGGLQGLAGGGKRGEPSRQRRNSWLGPNRRNVMTRRVGGALMGPKGIDLKAFCMLLYVYGRQLPRSFGSHLLKVVGGRRSNVCQHLQEQLLLVLA
jgi:hypothetical protein